MTKAFHLYPAIDLKDGQAVRLLRGEMETATVFNADPAAQAAAFRDAGFMRLHVVDLNGAFEGRSVNEAAVRDILGATDVPVQLGGGLRRMADVERWLDAGLGRVILGTAAVKNPELVKEACRAYPGRIVVGIDARGGKVAVEGWAEVSTLEARDLARRFEDCGVTAIVYTDIDRDGALQGVNVEATAQLAASISIPVIASGGVASLDDVTALVAAAAKHSGAGGIDGTIIGRALYDGRIDPAQALAAVAGNREHETAC